MKEQTQQPGVRKWAGDDMITLQAEPLSAIQGFFKEYGDCIIQGCAITPANGEEFNIAPGLLGLSGMDAYGEATFKVVPFSGVENVTLPLYFTLTHSVIDRVYGDGKVKPIAYDYRAAVSAVKLAAGVSFLELTATGGRRFVDAVKITEKLDKVGNGRDVTVTFSQSANRENIASGERLGGMFGKVVKWFSDLKALAFKDKVARGDLEGGLLTEIDGKIEKADSGDAIKLYKDSSANYAYAKRKELSFNTSSLILGSTYGVDKPVDALEISGGEVNALNQLNLKGKQVATIDQIPTTLPANGGNADTVGGKHASDFPVVNEYCDQNLNNLNGFGIMCNPLTNCATPENNYPIGDAGTLFYGTAAYESANQIYGSFINNRWFVRGGGTGQDLKTPWKELATTDVIPTSLPANGGNADTVGGSPAWRLQSVQEDGSQYLSNQYDIQSRYNAKGDNRFRLEIVGVNPDSSIYKDRVSVGHADVANNADTVDGHHVKLNNTWNGIINRLAIVDVSGCLEIGKYIDFHDVNSDADFDVRIVAAPGRLDCSGVFNAYNLLLSGKQVATADQIPVSLPADGGNADTLDGHHYNQFIHVVASNSIQAEDTDGSFCGFGYVANGFPTNGSLISFGGLGNEGKFITQIQANYDGGNEIYFRTRNNNEAGNPITSSWKRLARADEIPTTTDQIAETAAHLFMTPAERATITAQGIQIGTLANYDSYTETGKYYVFDVPGGPNWQNAAYFVLLEVEKLPNGGIYQTAKSSFIGRDTTISSSIESYSRAYTGSNSGNLIGWTTWKPNGNGTDIQISEKASYDDYTETGKYYVYNTSNAPCNDGSYFKSLEVERFPNGIIYQTVKCPSLYYGWGGNGMIYIYFRAYMGDEFFADKYWTSWRQIYPCSCSGSTTPTIADQLPPSDPPTATPALPPTATPTTTE